MFSLQPNVNARAVGAIELSLPPRDEQEEIVRRVDHLLALAETVGQRIEAASRRVERTSQAVLAKAFRGELITNSEDPAEVGAGA